MVRALVALFVCATACVQSTAVRCDDGRVCPNKTTCDDVHQLCVTDAQSHACDGKQDGDGCMFDRTIGLCDRGVCVSTACGNGFTEPNEACDDGNMASGDGCRADCQKLEICDGTLDENEPCDDGNANSVDGCDQCAVNAWTPEVIVGDAPAIATPFRAPQSIAVDLGGNIFVADNAGHRVWRIDATTRSITAIAGDGIAGMGNDNIPASGSSLRDPWGIAVDGLGNVFVAESGNHRVRRIDARSGTITTVAGTGDPGFDGDGVDATEAMLWRPRGIALDGQGNLYIADSANHRVRFVDRATGRISTVAGNGNPGGGNQLDDPTGVALDAQGLVIADRKNNRVVRASAVGLTTLAGSGSALKGAADGPALSTAIPDPMGIAFDAMGRLVIADGHNDRVRVLIGSDVITIAGSGTRGFAGDAGAAVAAQLADPIGVARAPDGSLVIADLINARVRRVDPAGTISTIAGNGDAVGDGGTATSARMTDALEGIAIDSSGNLYLSDTDGHRVRRVDAATGVITTVAGTGVLGTGVYAANGVATAAHLLFPRGLAFDTAGNLYIAQRTHLARVAAGTGVITSVAGTDGQLQSPAQIAIDAAGVIYIANTQDHTIKKLASGTLTTIAGASGNSGYNGDSILATSARLNVPIGIAVDGAGHVLVADRDNDRVRRIDAGTGMITTIAGGGTGGDGGLATAARLDKPRGVMLDAAGNLLVAEGVTDRVRRIDGGTGVITTIAGAGDNEDSGDGGSPISAQLRNPTSLALDPSGNVVVSTLDRVRRIAGGVIRTIAGPVDRDGLGPLSHARLADARAFAVTGAFTLIAGGVSGTLEALTTTTLSTVAGRYDHEVATASLARYRARSFGTIGGVAYDADANVAYISESTAHYLAAITLVDPANPETWTFTRLSFGLGAGYSAGPLKFALFSRPTALYLDTAAKRLYVADTGNHVIRAVDLSAGIATATVSTVVGTPATLGFAGDSGPAASAVLYEPQALTRCGNGDLFIADTGNHRIRRVDLATGTVTTVLGDGSAASSGEGLPARTFAVDEPRGVACDERGNVFVTSSTSVRVLVAGDDGVVDGSGVVKTIFGASPRTRFPDAVSFCLTAIAVIDPSTLRVADACNGMLVELRLGPAAAP